MSWLVLRGPAIIGAPKQELGEREPSQSVLQENKYPHVEKQYGNDSSTTPANEGCRCSNAEMFWKFSWAIRVDKMHRRESNNNSNENRNAQRHSQQRKVIQCKPKFKQTSSVGKWSKIIKREYQKL